MEKKHLSAVDLFGFLEHLHQEEKSAKTIEKYERDIRCFLTFADGRVITKELTLAYKRELAERKYAVRSINSMLAALNSMLTYIGRPDCRVKSIRSQRQLFCPAEK